MILAGVLLAATIWAASAAGDGAPAPPAIPNEAASVPHPDAAQITQGLAEVRHEEQERERELEDPRFVAEREASRHRFADAGAGEIEEVLRSKFGEALSELNADPGRALTKARLDHALGEGAAVVSSKGRTTLVEGPMPIEVANDEGDIKKVDLGLEGSPEGFEPENPIVETVIGKTAEDGVELGGEAGQASLGIVQDEAEGSVGRHFGEQNILFPEIAEGAETDELVSPTAEGVELFDLLRSVESPETIRYRLDLPAGASVKALPGGAAEVMAADGSAIAVIPKPNAVDAQGTYVPVKLEVEGDSVVLSTHHREEDLAYPILVDPEIVYEDWMHPNWYDGARTAALSYWSWATNFPSWYYPSFESSQFPGHAGLVTATSNGVNFPGGTYGEWLLFRNVGTYLQDATINYFWRGNRTCPSPNPYYEPYDFDGLYDVVQGHFNETHYNDANAYGNSHIASWGHEFAVGMATSSGGTIPCWRDTAAFAMELWWGDWDGPELTYVGGMPSGWVRMDSTPRTVSVQARDGGLGVQYVRVFGLGGAEYRWNQPTCLGTLEDPCAQNRSGTITYYLPGSSAYEGPQTLTVQAVDPVEHRNHALFYSMSLDGLPPKLTFSGQFATQTNEEGSKEQPQGAADKLSLPVYNLKIAAEDGTAAEPRSGVRNVSIRMDGNLLTSLSNPGCTASVCPRTFETTYPVKLAGLTEGEHTVEVGAEDFVGNKILPTERKIKFTYIPATGMKEEYVLQHFVLPDGHNYAEEIEYNGPELAVNVSSGNLVYRERSLKETAPSGSLELERVYNSQQPTADDGQWGHGWSIAATPEFTPQAGATTAAMNETGAVTSGVQLPTAQGQEVFNQQLHASVVKAGSDLEVSYEASTETDIFDSSGRIEETQLSEVSEPAGTGVPGFMNAFGSSGTGAGEFAHPAGIGVTSGGNLWVVDQNNHRLEEFTQTGELITSFGTAGSGAGQLSRPTSVAIDAEGDLWITDAGNSRIEKFSQSGEFLGQFGSYGTATGQFSGPEVIAIANGHVWIGDTYNARLQEFTEGGEFIRTVGSRGTGAGQMIEPTGVAIGPEGDVWVADWNRNRIEVFTEAGALVREFGTGGTGDGQFNDPDVIAVDREGHAWVGDESNRRVQEFGQAGEFITKFGTAGSGQGQFSFGYPMGIAVDSAGHIWLSDTGNNRLQEWSIPGFMPGEPEPAVVDYTYSSGALGAMTLDEPYAEADPAMTMATTAGQTSSVSTASGENASFTYSGNKLMSATSSESQANFEYDASNRLKKVVLPNNTTAEVTYDSYSRVIAVSVKPEGGTEKKTHFFYREEPREAIVWGGGNPEIIYNFGPDGSLVKWAYAETPPKLVNPRGSLFAHLNDTSPVENKTQTYFVNAESPHEIASIKVVVNGSALVAETSCEDNSSPPKHNCDQPEPLEWIMEPSEYAAGRLNIEVIATDFLGHSVAESFFVTIPQQPPPDPTAREKPTFASISQFREQNGLDREHPLGTQEMNRLILELLYEWESGVAEAMQSTAEFGVPMRAPELKEMRYRREYTDQAAVVIPEWAEQHAEASYGGLYVDDAAGGLIYVGFTQEQNAMLSNLQQSGLLMDPSKLRPFPTPPATPVSSLDADEPSVVAALKGNEEVMQSVTAINVAPTGSKIEVATSDPQRVRSFLSGSTASGIPVEVVESGGNMLTESRYAQQGPIVGGKGLIGEARGGGLGQCTAGFGAKAPNGSLRGVTTYEYFVLTDGHCYPHGQPIGVQKSHWNFEVTKSFGKVRLGPYSAAEKSIVDAEAIGVSEDRRSHSVLNGEPLEAQPISGFIVPHNREEVCWSGSSLGKNCGKIFSHGWSGGWKDHHFRYVYRVIGPSCGGDSGGPVWDPETHLAVGLVTGTLEDMPGYPPFKIGELDCGRIMEFTALADNPQAIGIASVLGVQLLGRE